MIQPIQCLQSHGDEVPEPEAGGLDLVLGRGPERVSAPGLGNLGKLPRFRPAREWDDQRHGSGLHDIGGEPFQSDGESFLHGDKKTSSRLEAELQFRESADGGPINVAS